MFRGASQAFPLVNLHRFPKKTLYIPIITIHPSHVCFTNAWNGAAGVGIGAENASFGAPPATLGATRRG
jgi:hypothetical protein